MNTCVLCLRRRKLFECAIRSRSRWKGVRTGLSSSGWTRSAGYERAAGSQRNSASCAWIRSAKPVMRPSAGSRARDGRGCRRSPAPPAAAPRSRAAGSSAIGLPSAATMNPCASSESRKPPPSHDAQTTPPDEPEKPVIPSRSPQRAQAASSGEKPAASASLSRKASPSARGSAAPSAGPRRTLLEQLQVAAEQVVGGPVRVGRVEQPQHGVAGARRRVESRRRRSAGADSRRRSRRRSPCRGRCAPRAASGRAGRTAPAAPRSATSAAASPSRSRSPARARPCTGAGSGPPRRSGCCAALSPRS